MRCASNERCAWFCAWFVQVYENAVPLFMVRHAMDTRKHRSVHIRFPIPDARRSVGRSVGRDVRSVMCHAGVWIAEASEDYHYMFVRRNPHTSTHENTHGHPETCTRYV